MQHDRGDGGGGEGRTPEGQLFEACRRVSWEGLEARVRHKAFGACDPGRPVAEYLPAGEMSNNTE